MPEMDRRVALLRLLLADITAREQQARDTQTQLRGQLTRIVDFTVRHNAGVSHALSSMDEVEERLAQQERMLRHLSLLRVRAQGELEALVVTRGVSDARARLAELEQRRGRLLGQDEDSASGELAEVDAEVAELQAMIQQASEAAARALTQATAGPDEPRDQSRRESRPR